MREFIAHVKSQKEQLVAEGVDRVQLDRHLNALEAALNTNAPRQKLELLLDELEASLLVASDGGVSANVLNLLNEIFGTGMPPV
jgi:hypothetical protein